MKLSNNESYYDQVFDKQILSNTRLLSADFEECEFNDCDFSQLELSDCKFLNCQFNRCNFSLATFPNSRLFELVFIECKLVGIDWTRAYWANFHNDFELTFKRCILTDASFFGLTLNHLTLIECKLHDVDFREGDFSHSTLTFNDFTNSVFMRTNLHAADLSESHHFSLNVLDNNVTKAKINRFEALHLLESLGVELVD
ncbi:hypothetical protein BCU68_15645 [Vibrio sp. 10N.286.49.B3]|uniref:pentapeptide repeat-containing protein n=1 Tax=Vibrio sp. 10N.286.49.B3 TaxID=1880855 RepID=UPI000C837128|nr:pentapeptide repeat-containing protein [Vibrio sp. 10N.286.49.B3]PMH41392.1 hypothetical protein BCU68_15645 [Vibrio sp. 10N.286.49.B3]